MEVKPMHLLRAIKVVKPIPTLRPNGGPMYHIRKRNPESTWRDGIIAALRVLARRGRATSQQGDETHAADASHENAETHEMDASRSHHEAQLTLASHEESETHK
jgi:rhamnogalacturonyl hydrolase YesR